MTLLWSSDVTSEINIFLLLQVGQEIEVRPGIVSKDTEGKLSCKPIFSRIVTLFAEQNDLKYAVPGGLIGTLHSDSYIVKSYKHTPLITYTRIFNIRHTGNGNRH